MQGTVAELEGDLDRADTRHALGDSFTSVREASEALAASLSPEDQSIQSMPDVSPTKWHLAHTSWFFETFVLSAFAPRYCVYNPAYGYLFNSYYVAVGERHPRAQRGLLSRPSCAEVMHYRRHVTTHVSEFMAEADDATWHRVQPLIRLGIAHEEQHQELILMDIKHVLSLNPLKPVYSASSPRCVQATAPLEWFSYDGGLCEIGSAGLAFAFDNEGPRHKVWLEPFRLASRPVTCGEYRAFIEDDGYRRPEFWLSDGWALTTARAWGAPLYWEQQGSRWRIFTLHGDKQLDPAEPVCHVSFYEADAYARWAGKRLPREEEWEVAARSVPLVGNLADGGVLHPAPAPAVPAVAPTQLIGDVWEWTASPYRPYPRFRAAAGAIGEYNGKFMANQMVLRGGCAVTPPNHVRTTYRNFFYPDARWAFSGIRLAEDA